MKRTGNKRIEDFPPSKLYLNDLQDILSLFEHSCKEVTIRTGEYENVKPSEIPELIDKLQLKSFDDIYIVGSGPYVTLDLRSFGISAYVSESSSIQLGLIAQVKDIIRKNRKKFFRVIPNLLIGVPMLAGMGAIVYEEWLLALFGFSFSFLMIWPAAKYQMSKTLEVFTIPKKKEPSFFKRRKDELIIAVTSAFLGAFFSMVLVKYLG
ncbi:hypothetical protein DFP83_1344 [Idiomarina fontislapidosi]|uniref:Uncharacterized protein n=1 Tax=Idiomarina fontislapidosi TaxID=263723 RepID=A0A432XDG9_9GAMM|nr:hypothetical protein [Idiomarina fontislapidosi]PYE30002.1 hypothetical protein DFP83_1344 [Idiomarina fontislapidosi]RUO46789.1 hypothetical protein CWE25_13445 [Idiomarina fontislapidosi]